MSKVTSQTQRQSTTTPLPASGILQRRCACGNHTIGGGKCVGCGKKHETTLQRASLFQRGRENI